jgi:site-specific DNA recombinase
MRVAVYVRVSTSRQVKLQTIEQQLERVRRHAWEKGWELPDENIFRDDGYSGTILGLVRVSTRYATGRGRGTWMS